MNRREFIGATMAIPLLSSPPKSSTEPVRPYQKDNSQKVISIRLDDLSKKNFDQWSSEGLTPSLDGLVTSAIRFENFQGGPLCGVFRCASLVGADPYRTSNLCGMNVPQDATWSGPAGTWVGEGMPGHRVILGKIHFLGMAQYPDALLRGCDEFHGILAQLNKPEGPNEFNFTYYSWWETSIVTGQAKTMVHHNVTLNSANFNTNVLTQRAIDAIDNGSEFIELNYPAVHQPLMPPPPNDEPPGAVYIGGATNPERVKEYMRHLDYRLSQVITHARDAGYVVILTSDNGQPGDGKGTLYQTGINCICFVWSPEIVVGTSTRLVCAQDLWATIRELRGATLTVALGGDDSWSFADDIMPMLFSERHHRTKMTIDGFPKIGAQPDANDWDRSIRNQRYQLLVFRDPIAGETVEFYDLELDPNQQLNLEGNLNAEQQIARDRLYAKLPNVP